MRIIAGKFKGRNIESLQNSNYRPSTSKFREAIFSMLSSGRFEDFEITKAAVIDLFCGTGSLGLEALSRGAKSICFVDIDNNNLTQIRSFVKKTQSENQVSYMNVDATKLCNAQMKFDLVLLDPPYKKNLVEQTLKSLLKYDWLNPNAYIIIECEKSEQLIIPESYSLIDERKYGRTKLLVLKYNVLREES
jgi:16S rRNA (guanine966-N2)-methyltransferase